MSKEKELLDLVFQICPRECGLTYSDICTAIAKGLIEAGYVKKEDVIEALKSCNGKTTISVLKGEAIKAIEEL